MRNRSFQTGCVLSSPVCQRLLWGFCSTKVGTRMQPCNLPEVLTFIRSAKCSAIQMSVQLKCMRKSLMPKRKRQQRPLGWICRRLNDLYLHLIYIISHLHLSCGWLSVSMLFLPHHFMTQWWFPYERRHNRKNLIMEIAIIDADNQHISFMILMTYWCFFMWYLSPINQYWDLPLLCGKINW